MNRGLMAIFVAALVILPMAVFGCKGKVEKQDETQPTPVTEATVPIEEVIVVQSPVTEPALAQTAAQETIPPTASVPPVGRAARGVLAEKTAKNKEIQTALEAAGFYAGNIDGKMGPKTRKAIIEFQKAKGLKPDGKVGPKTWAELDKYLTRQ